MVYFRWFDVKMRMAAGTSLVDLFYLETESHAWQIDKAILE
jgi:hypothetical protein